MVSSSWIARNCSFEIAYRVFGEQPLAACDLIKENEMMKRLVRYSIETVERRMTFRSDILNWHNVIQVIVGDASHVNEDLVGTTPSVKVKTEPHRSQSGKLTLQSDPSITNGEDCKFYLIRHSSTLMKRVCCATVAERKHQL